MIKYSGIMAWLLAATRINLIFHLKPMSLILA